MVIGEALIGAIALCLASLVSTFLGSAGDGWRSSRPSNSLAGGVDAVLQPASPWHTSTLAVTPSGADYAGNIIELVAYCSCVAKALDPQRLIDGNSAP